MAGYLYWNFFGMDQPTVVIGVNKGTLASRIILIESNTVGRFGG